MTIPSGDAIETLERNFRKRIRIAAQNSNGKCSSTWMFWGQNEDFYFGPKMLLQAFKVSLHKNGIGYVAYDKDFRANMQSAGVDLPLKSVTEWRLPTPQKTGAVQLASIILPANYCTGEVNDDILARKVLLLGVEPECAAEIGVFASFEDMKTLEPKFQKIGKPTFEVKLENGMGISIVVRSATFDPSILPTSERLNQSMKTELVEFNSLTNRTNLNAMIWNKPNDGEAFQVIDIGGLSVIPR